MPKTSLKHTKVFALAVALLYSGLYCLQAAAQQSVDYFPLITAYVNKIANIYDGSWAYTYTQDDKLEAESVTRRIDPSLDFLQQDALLEVNGQTPGAERLQEHKRRQERRLERRQSAARNERDNDRSKRRQRNPNEEDGREKERFLAMLIPSSIKLVKQENALLYLSFNATEAGREKIYSHLVGTLILDTDKEYIRELQFQSTEAFSPFFLTAVEDVYFSMRFALVNGVPMQQFLTWKLRGQALVLKDLDADMNVLWKDLTRIRNTTSRD